MALKAVLDSLEGLGEAVRRDPAAASRAMRGMAGEGGRDAELAEFNARFEAELKKAGYA